ncbi:hypothetical protein NPIL_112541 [Nephila pilipes]|uniref:Uncharacterized protein n=1 Tax=Nephila pilipes TaxID=299642 RepID=A0A8X6MX39_NEPPI|nr:hypothetical protein NPIL_112541 [Nephila pilipes]
MKTDYHGFHRVQTSIEVKTKLFQLSQIPPVSRAVRSLRIAGPQIANTYHQRFTCPCFYRKRILRYGSKGAFGIFSLRITIRFHLAFKSLSSRDPL